MLKFFDKINEKEHNFKYYLKYKLKINTKIYFTILSDINSIYYYRIGEIIKNCEIFSLNGNQLYLLPNKIKNNNLTIIVYRYDSNYIFPKYWNIKKLLIIKSFYNNDIKIPKSFKCHKIDIC